MAAPENQLIKMLPSNERIRMIEACDSVRLTVPDVLCESGRPMRHVYFPVQGFISLLTLIDGKPILEVGMVGSEGMLGAEVALGVQTAPLQGFVQGDGSARRMTTAAFRRELARSDALHKAVDRYLYVLTMQFATSAACLRFHQIGPRLARWLLMTQDRAHTDHYRVTHAFLAYMLGVRRVGITNAASGLQRAGLIEYHRGQLQVLDRKGLEAMACGCYAEGRRAYAKYLN